MRAIRALMTLLFLAIVAFVVFGFWTRGTSQVGRAESPTSSAIEQARERSAELGEKAAIASAKVEAVMTDAGLTSKIKAKMALDDLVRARTIDVSTDGRIVTLRGTVQSAAEHERAVALARETSGVERVDDRLRVER